MQHRSCGQNGLHRKVTAACPLRSSRIGSDVATSSNPGTLSFTGFDQERPLSRLSAKYKPSTHPIQPLAGSLAGGLFRSGTFRPDRHDLPSKGIG
jgi:hypothetical protein